MSGEITASTDFVSPSEVLYGGINKHTGRPLNAHQRAVQNGSVKIAQGKSHPRKGEETRRFRATLRELLIDEGLKENDHIDGRSISRIQRVVERIFDEAELGEPWACAMIFDRVEGKAPIQIQTEPGDTMMLVIRGASTDDL